MQLDSTAKPKLIDAAKAEFLRCGYQKASLRSISHAAGVTTGAIYFFFEGKEDLFHAVVDNAANALRHMLTEGAKKEYSGEASGEDNDRAFIECLHAYPEESVILLEKSEGSPLSGFRQELTDLLETGFLQFFYRAGGKAADAALIRLLVEQRVHIILSLIAKRLDLETTLRYTVLIGAYGDAGFAGMMTQYHKMQEGSVG